jgi:hypothetical protein
VENRHPRGPRGWALITITVTSPSLDKTAKPQYVQPAGTLLRIPTDHARDRNSYTPQTRACKAVDGEAPPAAYSCMPPGQPA